MSKIVPNTGFLFSGKLHKDSFIAFARHRAHRLGLSIDIGDASDEAISVDVSGASDLVDAFEMACSLGPYDCLVLDVARHRRGWA